MREADSHRLARLISGLLRDDDQNETAAAVETTSSARIRFGSPSSLGATPTSRHSLHTSRFARILFRGERSTDSGRAVCQELELAQNVVPEHDLGFAEPGAARYRTVDRRTGTVGIYCECFWCCIVRFRTMRDSVAARPAQI